MSMCFLICERGVEVLISSGCCCVWRMDSSNPPRIVRVERPGGVHGSTGRANIYNRCRRDGSNPSPKNSGALGKRPSRRHTESHASARGARSVDRLVHPPGRAPDTPREKRREVLFPAVRRGAAFVVFEPTADSTPRRRLALPGGGPPARDDPRIGALENRRAARYRKAMIGPFPSGFNGADSICVVVGHTGFEPVPFRLSA